MQASKVKYIIISKCYNNGPKIKIGTFPAVKRLVKGGDMKGKIEPMIGVPRDNKRMPSALDLWKLAGGGEAHRVKGEAGKRPPDSMVAVYGDRVTYTFILDDEVASIHFDRARGEIFYKGHNIRNMQLSDRQIEALYEMKKVIASDHKSRELFSDYVATLDRLIADNKSGRGG